MPVPAAQPGPVPTPPPPPTPRASEELAAMRRELEELKKSLRATAAVTPKTRRRTQSAGKR
jgi:hypothetical protein